MRAHFIAQGTLLYALLWPEWEGNPKGRGNICLCIADSRCWTVETNRTLLSNYAPIKNNFKKSEATPQPAQCSRRAETQEGQLPRYHHITDTHPVVHLNGQSPCFHLLPRFSEMWCSSHHCSWLFNSSHHEIPTISSSVVPFSSCLQSFPASGSFPVSQFFVSGGQSNSLVTC